MSDSTVNLDSSSLCFCLISSIDFTANTEAAIESAKLMKIKAVVACSYADSFDGSPLYFMLESVTRSTKKWKEVTEETAE